MTKTLYIGLGGLGGRVVSSIKQQQDAISKKASNELFVILDRDERDLEQFVQAGIPCISLRRHWKIKECIDDYKYLHVNRWFPLSPVILNSDIDSMGMTRVCGRLAFLDANENGSLGVIKHMLDDFFAKEITNRDVRVVIVSSLAGGTGSGTYVQMALWIRRLLQKHWGISGRISGFLAGPEVFIKSFKCIQADLHECDFLRANSYASLLELDAINSIKTGCGSSSAVKKCYDDLLEISERQSTLPIFDQLSIYEVNTDDEESISYDEHIVRMARNVSIFFGHHFPFENHTFPWNTNQNGMYLVAMGNAVAQYSIDEVVEYCSLRAAVNLTQYQTSRTCNFDIKQQAEGFIKNILELIDVAICKSGLFEDLLGVEANLETSEDVLHYVWSSIRSIEREVEKSSLKVSQICDSLVRKIVPRSASDINYHNDKTIPSLFVKKIDDGSVEYLSPNVVRDTIKYLNDELYELAKSSDIAEDLDFFGDPPVRLWFGNRDIEPSPNVEFPILVWQKNKIHRALNIKKFRNNYSEWFVAYCQSIREKCRKQMYNKIICTLFPMLIDELNGLCEALNTFDAKVNKDYEYYFAEHIKKESCVDTIKLCSIQKIKDDIFLKVLPYEKLSNINKSYTGFFWAQFCSMKWPEYDDNRMFCQNNSLIEACKDTIRYIKKSIYESSMQHIDFDATEALLYQECGIVGVDNQMRSQAEYRKNVANLCNGLIDIANKNFTFTYDFATTKDNNIFAKTNSTWFGVSKVSKYRFDIQDFAHSMVSAGVIDSNFDKTTIWCLKIAYGIKLAECPVMASNRYRDAYKRICDKANNRIGEPVFPHIDKRWAELLNNEH